MDAGPEVGQRGGHAPLGEGLFLLGREFLAASPLAWLFRRSFPPRLFHLRPDFRRALLAFCLRRFHQFPIGPALSAHAPRPLFVVGLVYGRQAQADARNPVPAPEILGGFFEDLLIVHMSDDLASFVTARVCQVLEPLLEMPLLLQLLVVCRSLQDLHKRLM